MANFGCSRSSRGRMIVPSDDSLFAWIRDWGSCLQQVLKESAPASPTGKHIAGCVGIPYCIEPATPIDRWCHHGLTSDMVAAGCCYPKRFHAATEVIATTERTAFFGELRQLARRQNKRTLDCKVEPNGNMFCHYQVICYFHLFKKKTALTIWIWFLYWSLHWFLYWSSSHI